MVQGGTPRTVLEFGVILPVVRLVRAAIIFVRCMVEYISLILVESLHASAVLVHSFSGTQ